MILDGWLDLRTERRSLRLGQWQSGEVFDALASRSDGLR